MNFKDIPDWVTNAMCAFASLRHFGYTRDDIFFRIAVSAHSDRRTFFVTLEQPQDNILFAYAVCEPKDWDLEEEELYDSFLKWSALWNMPEHVEEVRHTYQTFMGFDKTLFVATLGSSLKMKGLPIPWMKEQASG